MSAAVAAQGGFSDVALAVTARPSTLLIGGRPVVTLEDVATFVTQVLASGSVEVAPADSTRPASVQRRGSDEPATQWLNRVLRVALEGMVDCEARCRLVLAVIEHIAGCPVSLDHHPLSAASAPLSEGHPGRVVFVDYDSIYVLQGVPSGQDVTPLVETLALTVAAARPPSWDQDLYSSLAAAVASGDGHGFVVAIADAAGGRVQLRLDAGDVVAEAVSPVTGSVIQDVTVRAGEAVTGSIEIRSAVRQVDPDQLRALAAAMLRVIRAESAREELENEVALLDCLVELDIEGSSSGHPAPRRLVWIQPDPAITRWSMTGIRARARSLAQQLPVLSTLAIACHGTTALVGVYSDHGTHAVDAHRAAWNQLIRQLEARGRLRVAVSTPVSSQSELHRSHQALQRLGAWQRELNSDVPAARTAIADEIGPLWSALATWPVDGVMPYVRSVLGSLVDDGRFGGELTDTLYAYLQSGGSLRAAAQQLHLHDSTVKYRMRILRELLGDRLTDPNKRFELELALRVHLAHRTSARGGAR